MQDIVNARPKSMQQSQYRHAHACADCHQMTSLEVDLPSVLGTPEPKSLRSCASCPHLQGTKRGHITVSAHHKPGHGAREKVGQQGAAKFPHRVQPARIEMQAWRWRVCNIYSPLSIPRINKNEASLTLFLGGKNIPVRA